MKSSLFYFKLHLNSSQFPLKFIIILITSIIAVLYCLQTISQFISQSFVYFTSIYTKLFRSKTISTIYFKNILDLRLLQQKSTTGEDIQRYVLLLIIIFFVVIPVTVIIILVSLAIYKKCTQQEQQQNDISVNQNINLQQYNPEQIGPYIANPNDQCSICLDKKTNIRTFCGHFFHSICISTWYKKKKEQNRKATCPVCVNQVINPVKIYCTKCYITGKLEIIIYSTQIQRINEMNQYACNGCKKIQQKDSFSLQTQLKDNQKDNKQTQLSMSSQHVQKVIQKKQNSKVINQSKTKIEKDNKYDKNHLQNNQIAHSAVNIIVKDDI